MVAEKYDEVVFTNPKADFHQSLLDGHKKKQQPYPQSNEKSVSDHFRTYGDEDEIQTMLSAKKFLEGELRNVKDRLLRADVELEEVKHDLASMKEMEATSAAAAASGRIAGGTSSGAVAGGTTAGGSTKGGTTNIKGRGKKKKASETSSSQHGGKKLKTG